MVKGWQVSAEDADGGFVLTVGLWLGGWVSLRQPAVSQVFWSWSSRPGPAGPALHACRPAAPACPGCRVPLPLAWLLKTGWGCLLSSESPRAGSVDTNI